jgi:signal transduction histidine kinase
VNDDFAQRVLDSLEEHIAIVDRYGTIVATNRAWKEFAVTNLGDLAKVDAGTNYLAVCRRAVSAGDETAKQALIGIETVLAGRTPTFELEYACHSPSQKRWFILRATQLGGVSETAVVSHQNITVLKELERQREEWTSLIAHDLRGPVTIITAYAQRLLRTAGLGPEQSHVSIEHIERSAGRLRRMIADLLDVTRIEGRRLTLNRETVDITALLRQVLARQEQTLPEHELHLLADEATLLVLVDPVRFEQVVSNLVTNAAKYGDANTEITVQLKCTEHEVILSVTNRGPGIPPGEIPWVFARFYRTADAAAGQEDGFGLGLYIARGIVESHGGRIWAESIPQQTTTFHVALPLALAAAAG